MTENENENVSYENFGYAHFLCPKKATSRIFQLIHSMKPRVLAHSPGRSVVRTSWQTSVGRTSRQTWSMLLISGESTNAIVKSLNIGFQIGNALAGISDGSLEVRDLVLEHLVGVLRLVNLSLAVLFLASSSFCSFCKVATSSSMNLMIVSTPEHWQFLASTTPSINLKYLVCMKTSSMMRSEPTGAHDKLAVLGMHEDVSHYEM